MPQHISGQAVIQDLSVKQLSQRFSMDHLIGWEIHNYNETVDVADIITACKIYAAIILELVG